MERSPSLNKSKSKVLGSLSEHPEISKSPNGSSQSPNRFLDTKHKTGSITDNQSNISKDNSKHSSRSSSSSMSPPKVQNIRESLHQAIAMEDKRNDKAMVNNVEKRMVKLDLLENNQGFSISSSQSSAAESSNSKKVSRSHWKHPSTATSCVYPKCSKTLGLKNGTVNCRKCGDLFCNEHTNYKILLKNSAKKPVYNSTREGVWSKCCKTCYMNKPDKLGKDNLEPNSINVMDEFKKKRAVHVDNKLLSRDLIQKKFIKLVNILVQQYCKKKNDSIWTVLSKSPFERIEKEVVGLDNWESDEDVNNCSICFVKFNFLIRKHHCRLCGKIVCEDTFNERKQCSILVPLGKMLERVPKLNYSQQVKQNWSSLLSVDSLTFRCCVNCRDDILYDWKHENINKSCKEESEIFMIFDSLIILKRQIATMLPRYEEMINEEDLENINKLRNKLMSSLKDFENLTSTFRQCFYVKKDEKIIVDTAYESYSRLIMNIYQGSILFLQENLSVYKRITTEFKEKEQEKLRLSHESLTRKPDLTKKQIRELREELMVVNEQKFLIENLIEDYTKMRKFDELSSLKENKQELAFKTEELESKLGEYGF